MYMVCNRQNRFDPTQFARLRQFLKVGRVGLGYDFLFFFYSGLGGVWVVRFTNLSNTTRPTYI